MTQRQIDTSREIRQWTQLAIGIAGTAVTVDIFYPQLRQRLVKKCISVKDTIKGKFKKRSDFTYEVI